MVSPYKKVLKSFEDTEKEVTIHRANATDIKGRVVEVEDDGFQIRQPHGDEMATNIFIAYEDVRGVASTDWNYDVIS